MIQFIRLFLRFRINHKLNRLLYASLLFLTSIGIGIAGFIYIEDYNLVDAFYMTVITIATVGFTEVHPLSDTGRIFTSFFIIFNLGVFALFASVVTSYLFEGELNEIFNNIRAQRKMRKMENHVIICGYGKNGYQAGEELRKNGIPFIVLEKSMQAFLDTFGDDGSLHYIEADATQDESLKAAGIERAKALITTLPRDAENVFVTLSARQLNPNLIIIARAFDNTSERKLIRAGANQVVSPDTIGGTFMANIVTKPRVVEFWDMISGTGELKLEEFCFDDLKEKFKGKSIKELDIRRQSGTTIVAFKDETKGFSVNPHPDTLIEQDDTIIVMGKEAQIRKFADYYTRKKIKHL